MTKGTVYEQARQFKRRYPWTIAWRIKAHCRIIEMNLNPGEIVKYVFVAQKTDSSFDWISTNVIALTNKRILLGQKRLLFGYFYTAITPDLFNDLKIKMGLIYGKVYIDTIKEFVSLSSIQREALPEIETFITEYMMRERKKYAKGEFTK